MSARKVVAANEPKKDKGPKKDPKTIVEPTYQYNLRSNDKKKSAEAIKEQAREAREKRKQAREERETNGMEVEIPPYQPMGPAPAPIQPMGPAPAPIQPMAPAPAPIQPMAPAPAPIQPMAPVQAPMQPMGPAPAPIQPMGPAPALQNTVTNKSINKMQEANKQEEKKETNSVTELQWSSTSDAEAITADSLKKQSVEAKTDAKESTKLHTTKYKGSTYEVTALTAPDISPDAFAASPAFQKKLFTITELNAYRDKRLFLNKTLAQTDLYEVLTNLLIDCEKGNAYKLKDLADCLPIQYREAARQTHPWNLKFCPLFWLIPTKGVAAAHNMGHGIGFNLAAISPIARKILKFVLLAGCSGIAIEAATDAKITAALNFCMEYVKFSNGHVPSVTTFRDNYANLFHVYSFISTYTLSDAQEVNINNGITAKVRSQRSFTVAHNEENKKTTIVTFNQKEGAQQLQPGQMQVRTDPGMLNFVQNPVNGQAMIYTPFTERTSSGGSFSGSKTIKTPGFTAKLIIVGSVEELHKFVTLIAGVINVFGVTPINSINVFRLNGYPYFFKLATRYKTIFLILTAFTEDSLRNKELTDVMHKVRQYVGKWLLPGQISANPVLGVNSPDVVDKNILSFWQQSVGAITTGKKVGRKIK